MSVFLMGHGEDAQIDNPGRTTYDNPVMTQADEPGVDLGNIPGTSLPELPNPAIGGQPASRFIQGFSTGFKSIFSRVQGFTGAVAKPPAITNQIIGDVGMNNRASRLYAGVMDQYTAYSGSDLTSAESYVGTLPDGAKVK